MNNTLKSDRIEVVDALRGVALFAIVILHCFEHYNLYYMPDCQPHWLTALDKGVWDTVWFLFGGKAFSTFSLLFGLSFFIQFDNAKCCILLWEFSLYQYQVFPQNQCLYWLRL